MVIIRGGRGRGSSSGRGRGRGRPRRQVQAQEQPLELEQAIEQTQEQAQAQEQCLPDQNPPNQMQQMLEMLIEQRNMMYEQGNMINELRGELQEMKAKLNEDNEPAETVDVEQEERFSQPNIGTSQYWTTEFCKHQPPIFRGEFDYQVAENWMMKVEKIFRVMECPTEKKAELAIYNLEGDADNWWKNTELTLQAQNIPTTWEVFKERFNDEYFPQSTKDAMVSEFLTIQQGNEETFNDYLTRFNRLSHYFTTLRHYIDEEWKSERLIRGLKYEMREQLVSQQFKKFSLAVEHCRMVERNLEKLQLTKDTINRGESSRRNSFKKRKGPGFKTQGSNKKPSQSGDRVNQRPPEPQPCLQCGKFHQGRSCSGQIICYNCRKPGHFNQDCPQRTTENRPQNQGRVFALTHEEARKSPEMIQDDSESYNCYEDSEG